MAVADTEHAHHDDHDHHHDMGEFIAHHFESPEQQFDSGKLGIWLFLVTEILFFSGLFCAYTLWRNHHPEVFEQAHVFLDKYLGGLNTLVLLFSSLTMALGVRSAQLGDNKKVAFYTLITMVCASIFLGVKAIEYSHKWDVGIHVVTGEGGFAGDFKGEHYHPVPEEGTLAASLGVSKYLIYLSVIPAILLVAFAGLGGFFMMTGKQVLGKFFAGMAITTAGYFLGAVCGYGYMSMNAGGGHAQVVPRQALDPDAPMILYAQESPVGAATIDADEEKHAEAEHAKDDDHAHEKDAHAADGHADDGHEHAAGDDHAHEGDHAHDDHAHAVKKDFDRDVGVFFSIYSCMTVLHAIHILAGIGFLGWILYRSLAGHWRPDYFGPVDYVGLYWHIVDLIWIYLFPLLYLID